MPLPGGLPYALGEDLEQNFRFVIDEDLNLSESGSNKLFAELKLVVDESLEYQEGFVTKLEVPILKIANEALNLQESPVRLIQSDIKAIISETLNYSETSVPQVGAVSRVINESLELTESFTRFPAPVGLYHEFSTATGSRIIGVAGQAAARLDGFEAIAQAPGGFAAAKGRISQAELESAPSIYQWGTTWRVRNADDSDRVVWAGRLTDPQVSGGVATLQGQGWGTLADKDFDHLLWQTRDLDRWTVADSDPHNYNGNVSRRIAADVNGRRIRFKVARKEVFKRNNAGSPSEWKTGVVFWAPRVNLKHISFNIEKERTTSDYVVELLKATGPSGALTLVATYSLGAGQPTAISQAITGSPDLLMIRVKRSSQTDKARALKILIKDVRVNALAGSNTTYTTDQVLKDVAARIGGTTTMVDASSKNALPLDVEDVSAGALLDELALYDDRYWGVEDDGNSKQWRYHSWTSRTWTLTQERAPVDIYPLERFNKVRVPHRYPGGVKDHVTATASPNPLTGNVVLQVDLDDPLPPEDIALAFAQNIANYMGQKRFGGTATFTEVQGGDGVTRSAYRVRAGDTLVLANYGNLALRVAEVSYTDAGHVTARFADTHPLLERLQRRRRLILARGRSNAWATIGGFDLERPSVPSGVMLGFREAERRGGRRKFHAVLDWSAVTEDIEGNGTAIQRYVAQFRPVDASGTPIPETSGGGIHKVVIDRKNDDDPETSDIPTKAILRNLDHPHKWRWQGRVLAVDVLGEKSVYSGWTPYAKPATFGPPDPINLSVTMNAKTKQVSADWEAPDPEELDSDGLPTLDRRIAYFEVRLRRRLRGSSDPWVTYRGPKRVGSKTEHTFKNVYQQGRHRWRYEVRSVDHYGNTTSWGS